MYGERYSIQVDDDHVEIHGTITIREAFDFLSFFERDGYSTLVDNCDSGVLRLEKRNLDQEKTDRINTDVREENVELKDKLEMEKEHSRDLEYKLHDLEGLIQKLIVERKEMENEYRQKLLLMEKNYTLLSMKHDPKVSEIVRNMAEEALEES